MNITQDIKNMFSGDNNSISVNKSERVALKNVLSLAKERIWIANGRPLDDDDTFSDDLFGDELKHAEKSVNAIDELLERENHATQEAEVS